MQSNLNYFQALCISLESASTSLQCNIGPAGVRLLRQYEGLSLVPYRCPAGLWTIGYGHAIGAQLPSDFPKEISEVTADRLLNHDASIALSASFRMTKKRLSAQQMDAIACFIFNLGTGAYQRSTLRKAILRGEDDAIAHEWMRWVWAGGRKLPGLVKRRAAELALFQAGG